MKYLNKPSEKIITTESIGSTKMNFLLFHIDGRFVDRLFFANINKLNRYAYVNFTEKPQLDFH